MHNITYTILEKCRRNLVPYTLKAFDTLPPFTAPRILDIGCGSGVQTLALMDHCEGSFDAADIDTAALERLKSHARSLGYENRLHIMNASVFDERIPRSSYDLVLAEGLLNAVGFEPGLNRLVELAKQHGYLILHDELKDDAWKRKLFTSLGLVLLESFELNWGIWWKYYIKCLETALGQSEHPELMTEERDQIRLFRENPAQFSSVYYILKWNW